MTDTTELRRRLRDALERQHRERVDTGIGTWGIYLRSEERLDLIALLTALDAEDAEREREATHSPTKLNPTP